MTNNRRTIRQISERKIKSKCGKKKNNETKKLEQEDIKYKGK